MKNQLSISIWFHLNVNRYCLIKTWKTLNLLRNQQLRNIYIIFVECFTGTSNGVFDWNDANNDFKKAKLA